MHRPVLAAVTLAASLLAQGGPPTFVPKPHLARLQIEDVPKLLEQLPQSAIGKLLADPEVAAAWTTALQRYRDRADRTAAVLAAANARELPLEPWQLANLPAANGWSAVRELELADIQRVEFLGLRGEEQPLDGTLTATFACRARAEGRWTAIFERHAKALAGSKRWRPTADTRFAGFPAYGFHLDTGKGNDEQEPVLQDAGDTRLWLLHLPSLFAFGGNAPEACGTLAPPPPRAPAQVVGEMDLQVYVEMFRGMGGIPREFSALGFDALKVLRWRGQFVGREILDELEVELLDEPKGLVGALLAGKAALPAQPLPDDALVQLRCGVDLPLLLASAQLATGGSALPEALGTLATKAFTGGVALGVAAPAAGSLIPRIYLSLGIADGKAFEELLAAVFQGDAAKKQVTYEGTACTVLSLPGMPAGLQPTYCQVDGVLHVAESGPSMRALLKARSKGGLAMDVGDAKMPAGAGDLLPTFDLRCDEQALYRTFHKVWLPLFKLIPDGGELIPLLGERDMPSPDAVLPHLGKSRGVLRKDGKVYRLQQLGALGGVESAAIAMTWGPFLSGVFHRDYFLGQIENAIARQQLETVWEALEAFQKENKRWPNDLGELFASKKLPADALLLPGDTKPEPVPLPAGDARVVRSSFRYFAKPVKVDVEGGEKAMLLIAIAPRRYGRAMLSEEGATPEVWGTDSSRPIDQFGK